MSTGEKIKQIRKRMGFSQEQLAEILNVSRQAITKWENDTGLPDVDNLQRIARTFGVSVDYLLSTDEEILTFKMRKELDRSKYKMNRKGYSAIINEHFPSPWEAYSLIREKKLSIKEEIADFFIGAGTLNLIDSINDLSPYILVKRDNIRLLVHIKDYILEAIKLPESIDEEKFIFEGNRFMKVKYNLNVEK